MSDFSDRPFVAGSIFGLRAFRVDRLGRLTGIAYKEVWRPGENEAACLKKDDEYTTYMAGGPVAVPTSRWYDVGTISATLGYTSPYLRPPKVKMPDAGHTLAGVDCKCGFYAYFDGGNDYLPASGTITIAGWTTSDEDKAPRVGGIVEGFGVCTVGTRGFRASRAAVRALIVPERASTRLTMLADRLLHNYDVPVFPTETAALEAFPLHDPDPATPETADDFWTRSA